MNRITQNNTVSQGENPRSVPAGTKFEGEFREIHESAYSHLTQPQRVVVLPRYFINHWLPLLGPSRAWLVLAFRQCAFVTRSESPEVVRPLSIRQLTRWSGLSHGQVWNLLNDPKYLDWFVRKVESSPEQHESDVWGVQTSVPVAPQHLAKLEAHIVKNRPPQEGEKASDYLRHVMKTLPEILSGSKPDPEAERAARTTVQQIAESVFGPLDKLSSQLCDEITGRITQPGNTIAITHYFIDRWLPDLTNGESWMIFVLRTQVYASENTAFAHIEGGKTRLAGALGVNKRSVRRWFSKLESSALANFIKVDEDKETSGGLEVEIHLRDPIHPGDMQAYQQAIQDFGPDPDKTGQDAGQKWTTRRTKMDTGADKTDQTGGQNWTEEGKKVDSEEDKTDHAEGHNWTKTQTKLTALNHLNKHSESNDPTPEHNQPPQLRDTEPSDPTKSVVVGEGWEIDTILQTAGVFPEKRQKICSLLRNQPKLGQNLVGWVIYGYENRVESDGRNGIASPVLFALSRYEHSKPPPVYMEMAAASPHILENLMRNHFSPGLRSEWSRVLKGLENSGFLDILTLFHHIQREARMDAGAITSYSKEGEPEQVHPHHPPEGDLQQGLFPEPRGASLSAEEFWDEIEGIIGWEGRGEIVSMWLNGKKLELSLMKPEVMEKLALQLKIHMDEIQAEFPAYRVCLRLIRVTGIGESGLPVVKVVGEHEMG